MSARRRAARTAHAATPIAETDVVTLLRDPDAAVWHNQALYLAFMAARGWDLPPQERMGVAASAGNRRSAAADGWGAENGITSTPGHADWHRLRAMGLIA